MHPVAPDLRPALGILRGFRAGFGMLWRGFKVWGTSPRLMLLGMLPGVITMVVFGAAVLALALNLDAVAAWITPFSNGWDVGWRTALRIAVGLAVLVGVALVLVYAFAVATLAVGQPFFEAISRAVDDGLGGVVEAEQPTFWRGLLRGIGEALAVLALTLLIGFGLFLLSLVPLVGTVCAAVLGALTGGWFLALELTAVPLQRRGHRFGVRRRALGARRSVTLGFGVAVFLLFLIPLGAVIVMPAAVAGGTLLARYSLGEAVTPATT